MRVCLTQYAGVDALSGLPLAVGVLIATVRRDAELAAAVQFDIQVARSPLDEAVDGLGQPDLIGLSLYPWNAAYTLAVAARAREVLPDARIVAGGPAVPRQPESLAAFFEANPAVDVVVLGEGEFVFRELLRAVLADADLAEIPALVYRDGEGGLHQTSPEVRVRDFSETGSPYLDGTFDALVAAHPGRFAMAILETNRGCPFSCTFCDWSSTKKVVEVPLDRVRAELDWAAAQGMSTVCFTDANFGIRKRDRGIAEHLATLRRQTGSPRFCYFYLTKNNHKRNLETIEIFQAAGIDHCVGLAVQDFDADVLTAVRRDNIQSSHAMALREICAERGIRTHNELILGLPRQTTDSFLTTVLASMPGHPRHDFRIFLCRLIDNTELAAPQTREVHQIVSRRCVWRPTDASWDPIVDEVQEIVVGTRDMPIPDWRRTCRLAYYAGAAYNQRLLRVVLRFFDEAGVDRRAWLTDLCDAMDPDAGYPVHAAIGQVVDRLLDAMLAEEGLALPLEGMGSALFELSEAITATALRDLDAFYAEVRDISQATARQRLADDLLDDLFAFQSLCTPRHGRHTSQVAPLEHDWVAWWHAPVGQPLAARPTTVTYHPPSYVRVPELESFVTLHLAVGLAGTGDGALVSAPRRGASRPLRGAAAAPGGG